MVTDVITLFRRLLRRARLVTGLAPDRAVGASAGNDGPEEQSERDAGAGGTARSNEGENPGDCGGPTANQTRSGGASSLPAFDPADLTTPNDVPAKLGLMPGEFVRRVLEENDGRLKQQAFTDYTDWSSSTVSRELQRLEEEEVVVRIQVGREKTVFLPERAPANEPVESSDVPAHEPLES